MGFTYKDGKTKTQQIPNPHLEKKADGFRINSEITRLLRGLGAHPIYCKRYDDDRLYYRPTIQPSPGDLWPSHGGHSTIAYQVDYITALPPSLVPGTYDLPTEVILR